MLVSELAARRLALLLPISRTAFTSGAIVLAGSVADLWVVRCPAGRDGFFHLEGKVPGRSTYVTRVARTSDLRLVQPAPVYEPGAIVRYQGRPVSVLEDLGDEVTVVAGLSRVDAPKSELVLASL